MEKGLLRSKIRVKMKNGEPLELDKLPTPLAEEAYGKIRENVGRFQAPFSTGNASAPVVPGNPAGQTVIVQAQPAAEPPSDVKNKDAK